MWIMTYEEEVARVEAVAVQGHGPVAEEQVDELGDELLGVLVRAVHVVAARDDQRQVERPVGQAEAQAEKSGNERHGRGERGDRESLKGVRGRGQIPWHGLGMSA